MARCLDESLEGRSRHGIRFAVGGWKQCLPTRTTVGIERISFQRDGRERHVVGQVLVEDQAGGVLLQSPDSTLWIIPREEIVRREQDNTPFRLLTDDEMLAEHFDSIQSLADFVSSKVTQKQAS